MLRSLLMTLTICVTGAICAPTQAAAVRFVGTLQKFPGGAAPFNGRTAILDASWNSTNSTGPVALTDFSLTITGAGGAFFKGGASGNILFTNEDLGFGNKDVVTVTNFNTFTSGLNNLTSTNVALNSNTNLGPDAAVNATQANWDAIYTAMNGVNLANPDPTGVRGAFIINGTTYSFNGAAVPEPGSIALLSGLGLVFGAVRRRRQTRATAV
jgi:hypothetical protein